MNGIQEWTIDVKTTPYKKVKSLCWQGDALVDWAGGGDTYHLDGTFGDRHVNYAYRFDAAVISPSGEYAVIYEKLGTKGLILKDGKILREINRGFYYAHAYEYPVALFRLADGGDVIAHCPQRYFQIDIEEIETGKLLTKAREATTGAFFSRLSTNSSATLLLTAGWVWSPRDIVTLHPIEAVLSDSSTFDERGIGPVSDAVDSAAFLGDDKLVLTSSFDKTEEVDDDKVTHELPESLAVWNISEASYVSNVTPKVIVGTVMPVNDSLVVGFYEHPKLISLKTGKVLHHWTELKSGKQRSSILWTTEPIPPLALDSANHRFAVASETAIHVVQIDPASVVESAG